MYASEAELSAVWAGQLLARRSLRTEDGAPLRVIYRGLAGAGPGPDFREAIVAGPEGPRHGDVELHVRESDFRRHGHHLDPAYAGVVLHVVFEAEGALATALPGGGQAPVLVAPPPPARVRKGWEPARAWAEPCATAPGRLGPEACAGTLDRLGEMRFRQKVYAAGRELERADRDADVVIWAGLLEGLGYGGLREPFRELVRRAPWREVRGRMLTEGGDPREAAESLLAAALLTVPLEGVRTRPGNGPETRLRAAAALAARFAANGPAGALLPLAGLAPRPAVAALIAALSVPRLVGRGRAVELALNAVLPPAAACAGSAEEEARVEAVYASLPSAGRYGSVRHLERALTGVRPSARRAQGMLYLLKQYCTQGGCGRCPLS